MERMKEGRKGWRKHQLGACARQDPAGGGGSKGAQSHRARRLQVGTGPSGSCSLPRLWCPHRKTFQANL